jgi:cytochrome c oxidase subunit 2
LETALLLSSVSVHISVFNPASPEAGALLRLWHISFWVCGFVLAVVTSSLVYILIRFRRQGPGEPPQTGGNRKIEIAWTVGPILLVTFLFISGVLTARAVDHPARRKPDVIVTGHQWWWEAQYPAANAITANEIHIPAGHDILLDIETADVVHDFWAPRLNRKIDAVPGHPNLLWLRADKPGVYAGVCAEYCGPQHAWMQFRVVAQTVPEYQAWLEGQAAPAAAPTNPQAQLGLNRFRALTCANCHNIRGANEQKQYAPDLTHVASRKMLAGERLENTRANLRDWLHEPNIIKPNCLMPNLNLPATDLDALTAYLEGLK